MSMLTSAVALPFQKKGSTRMNTVAGLNGGAGWDRRRSCSLSRLYDHVEVSYNGGSTKLMFLSWNI